MTIFLPLISVLVAIACSMHLNIQKVEASSATSDVDRYMENAIELLDRDVKPAVPMKRTGRSKMVLHITIDLRDKNRKKKRKQKGNKSSVRGKRRKMNRKRKKNNHRYKNHRNHYKIRKERKRKSKALRKRNRNHKKGRRRKDGIAFKRNEYKLLRELFPPIKNTKRYRFTKNKKHQGRKTGRGWSGRWKTRSKSETRRQKWRRKHTSRRKAKRRNRNKGIMIKVDGKNFMLFEIPKREVRPEDPY